MRYIRKHHVIQACRCNHHSGIVMRLRGRTHRATKCIRVLPSGHHLSGEDVVFPESLTCRLVFLLVIVASKRDTLDRAAKAKKILTLNFLVLLSLLTVCFQLFLFLHFYIFKSTKHQTLTAPKRF